MEDDTRVGGYIMFVIVNIHKNYNKDKTYLSFDENSVSQYYFGLSFDNVCIFATREDARAKWGEIKSIVGFYNSSDSVMLEYINLQPDDFLK